MTNKSTIKEVQGSNVFCGPAVLAAITGIPTNEIAELINEVRHLPYYREVKGAYIEELLSTLTKIGGYRSTKINFLSNSSLFFTLTTIKQEGFYIVTLEHHFVLIEKQGGERYICDNGLKTPMKAEGSARLNQKVLQVYHIEKIGEHTYKKYTPPPAPILPYIPRVEGPSRLEIAMELLRKYKAGHDSIREEISEGEVEECKCEVCVRTRNFLSEKGD